MRSPFILCFALAVVGCAEQQAAAPPPQRSITEVVAARQAEERREQEARRRATMASEQERQQRYLDTQRASKDAAAKAAQDQLAASCAATREERAEKVRAAIACKAEWGRAEREADAWLEANCKTTDIKTGEQLVTYAHATGPDSAVAHTSREGIYVPVTMCKNVKTAPPSLAITPARGEAAAHGGVDIERSYTSETVPYERNGRSYTMVRSKRCENPAAVGDKPECRALDREAMPDVFAPESR